MKLLKEYPWREFGISSFACTLLVLMAHPIQYGGFDITVLVIQVLSVTPILFIFSLIVMALSS